MAALVAATAAAHWWGLRKPWPGPHAQATARTKRRRTRRTQPFRAGEFRLLVIAMALGGFCVHAVVVNLVPLLLENGLSLGAAATVMAVGGVGQVTGRLFYGRLSTITGPASRAWVTLGLVAVSTVAFAEIHSPWVLVAVVSFAGGMARGMFTLVQATAVSDRWGPRAYGARNGVLSGVTMGASALAPWAGSFLADHVGGFGTAFWLLAVGMLVAAAGIRPTAGRRAPADGSSGLALTPRFLATRRQAPWSSANEDAEAVTTGASGKAESAPDRARTSRGRRDCIDVRWRSTSSGLENGRCVPEARERSRLA